MQAFRKCPPQDRRNYAFFCTFGGHHSATGRRGMTQTDSDRIMELCRLICDEHNPTKFQKLVTELNQLLVRKERNLASPPDSRNAVL